MFIPTHLDFINSIRLVGLANFIGASGEDSFTCNDTRSHYQNTIDTKSLNKPNFRTIKLQFFGETAREFGEQAPAENHGHACNKRTRT